MDIVYKCAEGGKKSTLRNIYRTLKTVNADNRGQTLPIVMWALLYLSKLILLAAIIFCSCLVPILFTSSTSRIISMYLGVLHSVFPALSPSPPLLVAPNDLVSPSSVLMFRLLLSKLLLLLFASSFPANFFALFWSLLLTLITSRSFATAATAAASAAGSTPAPLSSTRTLGSSCRAISDDRLDACFVLLQEKPQRVVK